jgi:hypothetical protein
MLQQSNMVIGSTTNVVISSLPSASSRDPPMDSSHSAASPATISSNRPVRDVEILAAPVAPFPITMLSEITNGNSNSAQQPVLEIMVSVTRTPF